MTKLVCLYDNHNLLRLFHFLIMFPPIPNHTFGQLMIWKRRQCLNKIRGRSSKWTRTKTLVVAASVSSCESLAMDLGFHHCGNTDRRVVMSRIFLDFCVLVIIIPSILYLFNSDPIAILLFAYHFWVPVFHSFFRFFSVYLLTACYRFYP